MLDMQNEFLGKELSLLEYLWYYY